MTATDSLMAKWINAQPGYDCLVCGERSNHDLALMNLYATRLCLDHSNEFHEYTIKRGWTRKLHQLQKVRDANVVAYRGMEYQMIAITNATRAVDMYRDKIYFECKRWETRRIVEVAEARNEARKPNDTGNLEGQP